MYEYIITAFKVVVGVITNERVAMAGAVALGLMLIWIIFSLAFSFQARFTNGVRKINEYVSRNGISGDAKPGLDYLVSKMPTEFIRGYKAFERNPKSLPSENIKRFESLDMELSGGVFNQNKSVLKTYMNIVFVVLLLLSTALLGQDVALSGYLIAEAFIIPLCFLFLAKILYYVYTAIRQNQYHGAVEEFNEMLDNLDAAANFYSQNRAEVSDIDKEFDKPTAVEHAIVSAMNREQGLFKAEAAAVQEPVYTEESFEEQPAIENVIEGPAQPLIIEEESSSEEAAEDSIIQRYKAFLSEAGKTENDVAEDVQEATEGVVDPVVEPVEQVVPEAEDVTEVVETEEVVEPVMETEETFEDDSVAEEVVPMQTEEENTDTIEETLEEVEEYQEQEEFSEGDSELEQDINFVAGGIKDNFTPDFSRLLEEEQVEIKRGRGRPRKEVREEGEFVIKNDKEFEEALIRAEKLMRKNEEPLSASQTKRIEKQIKELVDAMTKYKEGI